MTETNETFIALGSAPATDSFVQNFDIRILGMVIEGMESNQIQQSAGSECRAGIRRVKYDPDSEAWILQGGIGEKTGEKFEVDQSSSFYVFIQSPYSGFDAYPAQEQYTFRNAVQNYKPPGIEVGLAAEKRYNMKKRTNKTVDMMKRKRESIDDEEESEGEPRSKKRTDSQLGGKFESRFTSFDNDSSDDDYDESKKGKGKKQLIAKRKCEVDCMSMSDSLRFKASRCEKGAVKKNKPHNDHRSSGPSSASKLEKAKQRLKLNTIGAKRCATMAKFGMEMPETTQSDRPNNLVNEMRCLKKMDSVETTIKRKITHLYC